MKRKITQFRFQPICSNKLRPTIPISWFSFSWDFYCEFLNFRFFPVLNKVFTVNQPCFFRWDDKEARNKGYSEKSTLELQLGLPRGAFLIGHLLGFVNNTIPSGKLSKTCQKYLKRKYPSPFNKIECREFSRLISRRLQ